MAIWIGFVTSKSFRRWARCQAVTGKWKLRAPWMSLVLLCALPWALVAQNPAAPPRNTAPPTQNNQQMMQVVALVNGQQISRQLLANECIKRYGEQVIESIINKQLVINELRRNNIVITEGDVNDEIRRQAAKINPPMNAQAYLDIIRNERNISIDRIKNDIFWMQLALQRLAAQQIQVSEAEISQAMEAEFGEKVQIQYMALKDQATAEQLRQQLESNPEEFDRMAMKHSIDRDIAARRGILPPIVKGQGDSTLEKVAFSLQPGQISQVFTMGDAQVAQQRFCLVRCIQKFPAIQLAGDQLAMARQDVVDDIKNNKLHDASVELFKQLQQRVKVVNVYNNPELSEQMPGVAATVDGQPILMRDLSEECIARFGVEVLDLEINRTLLQQALQKTGQTVVDADVEAEIQVAARDWGFVQDGKVNVEAWLNSQTNNDPSKIGIYIQDVVWPSVALRKLVEDTVEVTDDDMRKGFEANFGEKVDVLAIILSDQRSASEVWKMATAKPSEKFFGQLASEYSTDITSRNNRGRVDPIPHHGGFPELEKEAFRLNPGEISGIVQLEDKWVILYCRGRTRQVVTEIADVRNDLHANILNKKTLIAMNEYFGLLRSSAQLDNFLTGTSQTGRQAVENARQNPLR